MHNDFFRKTLNTLCFRVLALFLGVGSSVLLVRGLSVKDYGAFTVVVTVLSALASAGSLGIHASNVFQIGKSPASANHQIGNSIALIVTFSIVVSLGFALLVRYPHWFSSGRELVPNLAYAIFVFPAVFAMTILPSLLRGLYLIKEFNFVQTSVPLLKIIFFGLALWMIEGGLVGAFIAYGFVHWCLAITVIVITLKNIEGRVAPSLFSFRKSINYGAKAYAGEIIAVAREAGVIVLIGYFLSASSVAFFVVARNLVLLVNIVNQSVSVPLFPRLTSAHPTQVIVITNRVMRITFAISVLVSSCAWLFGPLLIRFLYGSDYESAIQVFLWMLPAVSWLALIDVFTNYLMSIGRPDLRGIFNAIHSCFVIFGVVVVLVFGGGEVAVGKVISGATILAMFVAIAMYKRSTRSLISLKQIFIISDDDFRLLARNIKTVLKFLGN